MNPPAHKRQQILQQMEQIQRMEYGSLQQEHRPSQRSPGQHQGPYFKHQVWENGQNLSRRIPADQANALAEAIEGRKQFEQLADQFIDTTVTMTRAGSSPTQKKTRRFPNGRPGGDGRVHRTLPEQASRPAATAGFGTEGARTPLEGRRSITRTGRAMPGRSIRCLLPAWLPTALGRASAPVDSRTLRADANNPRLLF